MDKPCWTPDAATRNATRLAAFMRELDPALEPNAAGYQAVWQRSIDDPNAFWRAVWKFTEVIGDPGRRVLERSDCGMRFAKWFPEAHLNFAENLLRPSGNEEALVFWGEDRVKRRMSRQELRLEVARFAAALRALGVQSGDRVAAWLPNMPETIVVMLAAASIGAIFTSASPDFGVQGALDRFGQIAPKVLVGVDGYFYNGKSIDVLGKLAEVAKQLPSVERVVVVPYVSATPALGDVAKAVTWGDFIAPFAAATSIEFTPLPFDHPLYIMYSSGTTGVPKCMARAARCCIT